MSHYLPDPFIYIKHPPTTLSSISSHSHSHLLPKIFPPSSAMPFPLCFVAHLPLLPLHPPFSNSISVKSSTPLSTRHLSEAHKPYLFRAPITCELQPGTELTGRVTHITSYGAFIDLGSHGSGLVHISQIADSFVTAVEDYLSVNEVVNVRVLSVDPAANRIALSIKQSEAVQVTDSDRTVKLGGDYGDPWDEEGDTKFVDLGPREKGPEAWESDSALFEEFAEKDIVNNDQ